MNKRPRRLIEVDLPIKRISEHARNEKNLRKGHPWNLHIWWARRPWGACRSVELASLLPDPVDPHCPQEFLVQAAEILSGFGPKLLPEARLELKTALLQYIGEMANFDVAIIPLIFQQPKS
jgi:putative DNA methylase